jgi:hypothetical protein
MTQDAVVAVERAFVAHLWSEFAAGRPVRCIREEHGTVGLAVTQGFPQAYQLRCSNCPWCSEWFFVEGDKLRSLHAAATKRRL